MAQFARSALDDKTPMPHFFERGGGWVLSQMAVMATVFVLGLVFHASPLRIQAIVLPGGIIMGLGGIIAIAGVMAFGRNLTPFPKPRPDSQLVQHGIYGLMRHPLYTSLMLTAFGWALFRQSGPALAGAAVFALFLDAKARREERWMLRAFPEYQQYTQRVRRFFPWIY